MVWRPFRLKSVLFLLIFFFICPASSFAIEINFENPLQDQASQKTQARYSVDVEGLPSESISVYSESFSPEVSLNKSLSNDGASVSIDVSSRIDMRVDKEEGEPPTAVTHLRITGDFSTSPKRTHDDQGNLIDVKEARYDAGAYAGIQTTMVSKHSEGGYDTFWGHEVDGMPVVATSKYYGSVNIATSHNFQTQGYYPDYQYKKDDFEAFYGPKSGWVGENASISFDAPPQDPSIPFDQGRDFYAINRTDLASLTIPVDVHYGQYSPEEPRTQTFLSQLGNKTEFIAEVDCTMKTLGSSLPGEGHFNMDVSHVLSVETIQPSESMKVSLKLIPDVPRIVQADNPDDPDNPLVCRHAAQAMIAKYWGEKKLGEGAWKALFENDANLMQKFLSYEGAEDPRPPVAAKNINTFLNEYINKEIIDNKNERLFAQYYTLEDTSDYPKISAEVYLSEMNEQHPVLLGGLLYSTEGRVVTWLDKDGKYVPLTHVSVAYGILEITDSSNGNDNAWLALNDTWFGKVDVMSMDGTRLWVQEGGEINNNDQGYNYDVVKWCPGPDIEANEGLFIPGGQLEDPSQEVINEDMIWKWQGFVLTRPVWQVSSLAKHGFNSPTDLENIFPIDNSSGTIEIIQSPDPFGTDDSLLYLFSPDGSPVGFGLDSIFPEDFEISFKYRGLGDGILQIILGDTLLRELDVSGQELGDLLLFDETFHASSLGIDPYEFYRLSFILKSSGDPELYFDDLYLRNLNYGDHGGVIPEPGSLLFLSLGLGGFLFRNRRKI